MRKLLITTSLLALTIPAFAQTPTPPANRDANTPAVTTPSTPTNPAAPVAGSNSFTEGQAKSRLETDGYSGVSGLKKDDNGVWRGKATKGGQARDVSVDFQGNVVGR